MKFYELSTWKKVHSLTLRVYQLSEEYPTTERFGLIDQLRRASSSVGANIAEGHGRFHFKDRAKFYYNARGSLHEVQNFLFLAHDLGYHDAGVQIELNLRVEECDRMLNGLIRSLKTQK